MFCGRAGVQALIEDSCPRILLIAFHWLVDLFIFLAHCNRII